MEGNEMENLQITFTNSLFWPQHAIAVNQTKKKKRIATGVANRLSDEGNFRPETLENIPRWVIPIYLSFQLTWSDDGARRFGQGGPECLSSSDTGKQLLSNARRKADLKTRTKFVDKFYAAEL